MQFWSAIQSLFDPSMAIPWMLENRALSPSFWLVGESVRRTVEPELGVVSRIVDDAMAHRDFPVCVGRLPCRA